ncbi:hypothetical protein HK23_06080 [Acetobacter malorum]|uniref:Uncharacterized protein n=1 Tax=Acetobacter malorum TaxID=178901 RepID=A0A1Y3G4T7_9PROT|nr:hypothetical protein HK23_06080 [Acetobacter malorum]
MVKYFPLMEMQIKALFFPSRAMHLHLMMPLLLGAFIQFLRKMGTFMWSQQRTVGGMHLHPNSEYLM